MTGAIATFEVLGDGAVRVRSTRGRERSTTYLRRVDGRLALDFVRSFAATRRGRR